MTLTTARRLLTPERFDLSFVFTKKFLAIKVYIVKVYIGKNNIYIYAYSVDEIYIFGKLNRLAKGFQKTNKIIMYHN